MRHICVVLLRIPSTIGWAVFISLSTHWPSLQVCVAAIVAESISTTALLYAIKQNKES